MGHVAPRQRRAPERKAARARVGPRLHDDDLDASPADVDDRQGRVDRLAGRRSEQVEQPLLLVAQDVERDAGRSLDGRDDCAGVCGATERLGADEGDLIDAERPGAPGVAHKESDELLAEGTRDRPVDVHGVPEAEEDRLVGERVEVVPVDGRDQQVDGVRADVDGAEDRVRAGAAQRSGAPVRGTRTRRAARGRGFAAAGFAAAGFAAAGFAAVAGLARGGGLRGGGGLGATAGFAAAAGLARAQLLPAEPPASASAAPPPRGWARRPAPSPVRRPPPRAQCGGPRPRAAPPRGATRPLPRA